MVVVKLLWVPQQKEKNEGFIHTAFRIGIRLHTLLFPFDFIGPDIVVFRIESTIKTKINIIDLFEYKKEVEGKA